MILVVGCGGQVGAELMRRAGALSVEARGVDRVALDITQRENVAAMLRRMRPRVVINASAYTAVDSAEADREAAFAVNAEGPAHLAIACAEIDAALIHISTDYVFGGGGERAWREDDVPAPRNVYGQSKLTGERVVAERLERALIVRTAWVFGALGRNFVRRLLQLGAEREDLSVVADQWGSPTPASALADALLKAGRAISEGRDAVWGTYHFAGAPHVNWHGFAEEIFEQACEVGLLARRPTVVPIPTSSYPTLAARPANSRLDCTRWANDFGDAPADWRAGLRDMLRELRLEA